MSSIARVVSTDSDLSCTCKMKHHSIQLTRAPEHRSQWNDNSLQALNGYCVFYVPGRLANLALQEHLSWVSLSYIGPPQDKKLSIVS